MKKAPELSKVHGACAKPTAQSQFTSKPTTTEAQHARIIEALLSGPKTSHEMRCLGVYQVGTRILELRQQGFSIRTTRVTLHDRDGYAHPRCALYSLESGVTQ